MHNPDPWYIISDISIEDFIYGMLSLGRPLEMSLVGVFDESGRGSRRDIDLPLHRDGEYSAALAEKQGGVYIKKDNIDIVGLYCIREGSGQCFTLIDDDKIELRQKQALIFDNKRVLHGREGEVGERLLIRFWIQRKE